MLLRLTEWKPSTPLELTPHERMVLEDRFNARISAAPSLGRQGSAEQFIVQPGSVVGTVTVGDQTIVVTPKLPIDRVLFMTAYTADPHSWQSSWSQLGTSATLTDGMATLFLTAYERTVSQGLLRSYRTVDADAATIRGRVRLNVQARRVAPVPIAIRYQLHDDDIFENHVLRAAVSVLRRQRFGDNALAFRLARVWTQLQELMPTVVTVGQIDRIRWTRHNVHYQPLIGLARAVIGNSMVDVIGGDVPVTGFTLRLYDVFEQFVRTALRETLGADTRQFPDQPAAHALNLDDACRVGLEPDLGYRTAAGWRFVGDVKYKRDRGAGTNPDLYQLLAYAVATGLPQATLVYADGPPSGADHGVGRLGITLHARHLNLNQPPTRVLAEVRTIGLTIV